MSKPEKTEKWTKTDLRTLADQIDAWWLVNRPLSNHAADHVTFETKGREMLAARRKDIVLAGLRAARATSYARYEQTCGVIGNQLVRFMKTTTEPNELVDRFVKSAREEDAAGRKLEALVLRVHHGELPPEVVAYDPWCKKETRP